DRLGWKVKTNEPENDTKLRSIIISMMLYGEDKVALKTALDEFTANNPEDLDPELRTSIMSAAVKNANDRSVIDHLLDAHKKTSSNQLQEEIAAAITTTRTKDSIDFVLGLLQDTKRIRPQD